MNRVEGKIEQKLSKGYLHIQHCMKSLPERDTEIEAVKLSNNRACQMHSQLIHGR